MMSTMAEHDLVHEVRIYLWVVLTEVPLFTGRDVLQDVAGEPARREPWQQGRYLDLLLA